jgi:hypothetical protein
VAVAHMSALLGGDLQNCRDSPASVISVDWPGNEADETEEAVSRRLAVKPNSGWCRSRRRRGKPRPPNPAQSRHNQSIIARLWG